MRRSSSVHALAWREIRTSAIVMGVVLVLFVRVGISSFNASGGAKGMGSMRALLQNPAMAALYGRVRSLPTGGALVEWKMGMFMALGSAAWATLAATRILRAGEDSGTWDLLVLGRLGRQRALASTIRALAEGAALMGLLVFLALATGGQRLVASLLYGAGIAGVTWFGAALGVAVSQVFAPRRSATQAAASVLAVFFIIRMLADGSASGAWARWLSPFGWLENLGSFHHRDPWWLVALVLVPGVLAYVGWRAQSGRDIGSALWTRADDATPREALLGSPWTFSWRERRAMVLVWLAGLGVFGAVLGYLTHTLVAFAATDRSFVRLLDHWGFGAMVHGAGFIGEMGVILSLATSLFVVAMIVVVGGDGETGRLDLPLSYGTSRAAWLGAAVTTCLVSVVVLAGVCATTMWLGVVASGSSMGITTPLEALANALGTAPLYLGVTMVLVALVPRFAYVTMAALLSLDYLVAVLGPILRWPSLVIEASPFHYLRAVPVQSSDVGAIGVMTLIGLVVGALGFWRFMTDDVGH